MFIIVNGAQANYKVIYGRYEDYLDKFELKNE